VKCEQIRLWPFRKFADSQFAISDFTAHLVSCWTEKEEMCNLLNEYFGSVCTSENCVNKLPEVKCFSMEIKVTC